MGKYSNLIKYIKVFNSKKELGEWKTEGDAGVCMPVDGEPDKYAHIFVEDDCLKEFKEEVLKEINKTKYSDINLCRKKLIKRGVLGKDFDPNKYEIEDCLLLLYWLVYKEHFNRYEVLENVKNKDIVKLLERIKDLDV